MTIKKVEQDLQVPRATIRFYEKKGLLSPNRSENGYRDYSDEDLTRLTVFCIDEGWSVKNFLTGLIGIVYMLIIEAISAVPMYFLGKKYPWVARHRTLLFYVIAIVSSVLVAVVLNIID